MFNKTRNIARKYASKAAVAALAAPFAISNAMAADEITSGMDAVDLTGLAVKVVAAGVLIVGVALAFKGPDLGKRVVRKV